LLPDVEIQLAKLAFIVTKGDSLTGVDADFEGRGANGLDDPVNQTAGEAFAMVPPLALSKSEHWGFGIEKLVLDSISRAISRRPRSFFDALPLRRGNNFRGIAAAAEPYGLRRGDHYSAVVTALTSV